MWIRFSYKGLKFLVDSKVGDLYPFIDVFIRRFYDSVEIRSDSIIVDVGAHVGFFTVKAATKAKKGIVIAIEPHPENFRKLLINIKLNNLNNVIPLNLALWDRQGTLKLYNFNLSGIYSVVYPGRQFTLVKANTLDNVLKSLGIDQVDLVKIDVEGAELKVLKGATASLKRRIRSLILEAHSSYAVFSVAKLLKKYNFKVSTLLIPQYTFRRFVRGENLLALLKFEIIDHITRWVEKKTLLRDMTVFVKRTFLAEQQAENKRGEYCVMATKMGGE